MRSQAIIPAIIAKSQSELDEKIAKVAPYSTLIQLDIMDGKFVPNTSIDFDFTLPAASCEYEAHLMIADPVSWIRHHANKVHTILAHIESVQDPAALIEQVRQKDKQVGFVLNPETSLDAIRTHLDDIDQVLIMTVNPGFYGSPFLPEMVEKIAALRKEAPALDIEVDGGITPDTLKQVYRAGANMFVSGSYIVKAPDVEAAVQHMKSML
ncbi:MAG: ribulose-phosphate 3-epimerase [Candidatus Thermoplasmatota archaeon]|nr:ribulose-phosphate 3-epimerase [Candidatus Thermoplasmatota archaeon]